MSGDPKLDEAKKLIDTFGANLLALNDGKVIPRKWKNELVKALRPERRTAGRKHNYEEAQRIVKEIFLGGDSIFRERTKQNNPATRKRAIAAKLRVKEKQVTRRVNDLKQELQPLLAEWNREGLKFDRAKLDRVRALLGGIGDAAMEIVVTGDDPDETINRTLTAAGLQSERKTPAAK